MISAATGAGVAPLNDSEPSLAPALKGECLAATRQLDADTEYVV
jgi:hypothetical protein